MHLKVQNGTKCPNRLNEILLLTNNFTNLHGDIVYVIFPGQMVVNWNTYTKHIPYTLDLTICWCCNVYYFEFNLII